jgi:hypothetical protein
MAAVFERTRRPRVLAAVVLLLIVGACAPTRTSPDPQASATASPTPAADWHDPSLPVET